MKKTFVFLLVLSSFFVFGIMLYSCGSGSSGGGTTTVTDYSFGPYNYAATPTTETLAIPSGATVYLGNLSTEAGEKPGFCSFGYSGYLKANGEFIGYEQNYSSPPAGSWTTYYYKNVGGTITASTESSFSTAWVKYRTGALLAENGTWTDITALVNLGQTSTLEFYHYTGNAKGFIIRIIK